MCIVPRVSGDCSPSIVDRSFKNLAAVRNNVFNDMHV
jgi:hypothetical protein